MRDLFFVAFLLAVLTLGFRRPFLFVLVYVYIDTVAPQRLSYYLLNSLPLSMFVACLAFARLAALREEGRPSLQRPPGAFGAPARLQLLHDVERRLPDRGGGEMGLGVDLAGLRHLPSLDPAIEAPDRGACCCS